MSSLFVHSKPAEFTDEDRYRFGRVSFSKTTFICILCGLGLSYMLYKIFGVFGLPWVGILIGGALTIMVAVMTSFPFPDTNYLKGGEQKIIKWLFLRYIRKKKKVIYVKGYKQ